MNFYLAFSFLKHALTAHNRRGHGIHSPHLFRLVNDVLPSKNPYYCFEKIEPIRQKLLTNQQVIEMHDFGTKGKKNPRYNVVIQSVAKNTLMPAHEAQQIFRLLVALQKPCVCVELGTSLGITTAYLASANIQNRIYTFEGAETIADMAAEIWHKLNLQNIELIRGNINETLPHFLNQLKTPIDFAILDANHTFEATMQYFEQITQHIHQKTIVVVDDIHASGEMHQAWKRICQHPLVTATVDMFAFGLVFFDSHYIKQEFIC